MRRRMRRKGTWWLVAGPMSRVLGTELLSVIAAYCPEGELGHFAAVCMGWCLEALHVSATLWRARAGALRLRVVTHTKQRVSAWQAMLEQAGFAIEEWDVPALMLRAERATICCKEVMSIFDGGRCTPSACLLKIIGRSHLAARLIITPSCTRDRALRLILEAQTLHAAAGGLVLALRGSFPTAALARGVAQRAQRAGDRVGARPFVTTLLRNARHFRDLAAVVEALVGSYVKHAEVLGASIRELADTLR